MVELDSVACRKDVHPLEISSRKNVHIWDFEFEGEEIELIAIIQHLENIFLKTEFSKILPT